MRAVVASTSVVCKVEIRTAAPFVVKVGDKGIESLIRSENYLFINITISIFHVHNL